MNSAEIILQQLGGSNRLKVMIGAKDFFHSNNGNTLQFSFKMCKTANKITITHNIMDLYDIKFYKINMRNLDKSMIPVEEWEGVYAEDMKRLIENYTGLRLSL